MKIKRAIIFTLLSLTLVLPATGQSQSGYVRTAGRPDKIEGKRLPGTAIRFRGKHNAVVSDRKGLFSIQFGSSETSYIINSVVCDGYELQEKELLGRREPISESIPKEIVMVSLKEKMKIEDKVRRQVETKYQTKIDALQKELDEHKISEGEYKAEMKRLNDEYEIRDRLIHDMVERYAHSDYAKMNAKEIEINTYIENGELEKADSVINSLNIAKLEADRSALMKDIDIRERQLEAERLSVRSIDSTLWMAYRAKADIFFADFQHDSVLFYQKKALTLDSTNVELLIDIATQYSIYAPDYDKAMFYFNKAVKLLDSDSTSHFLTMCMNDIGIYYLNNSVNDSALFYLNEALRLARRQGDKFREALALNNLSGYYNNISDRENQKKCIEESMALYFSLYGQKSEYLISSYTNLTEFYSKTHEYRKAIDCQKKALKVMPITKDIYRKIMPCYNNLGLGYQHLGMLDSAGYWYNKALDMAEKIYGNNHPEVAVVYGNMANLFKDKGNLQKALELHKKALAIYVSFFKDYNADIAFGMNNVSSIYGKMEQNDSSMKYASEALRIYYAIDTLNPTLLIVYSNIGSVLTEYGQLNEALDYFVKADNIAGLYPDENKNGQATLYMQIGNLFYSAGRYGKALAYYEESLKVLNEIYDKENFNYFTLLHNIGVLYNAADESEEALKYLNRAERILEDNNLTETIYEANNASSFCVAYHAMQKHDTAKKYAMKAYKISVREYGDTSIMIKPLLSDLVECYYGAEQYDSSLYFAHKQIDIMARHSKFEEEDYRSVYTMINTSLHRLGWMDECSKFMADKSFVLDVLPEGEMALRGYEGTYYLLAWKGWDVNDTVEFVNSYSAAVSPYNVVIYRDGKIHTESFEGKAGCSVHMSVIGREKKEEIVKAYNNRITARNSSR